MKSKLIQQSKNELSVFANTYEALSGNKVDLTYLENANVRAFYNEKGELIGGYAVSTYEKNGFLRYLNFLGEKQNSVLASKKMHLPDFVEITYTFFTRLAKRHQRVRMLSASIFDALKFDKKYLLGGGIVSGFNSRMKNVLQKVLFEGEALVSGNVKTFTILYEERRNLILNWLKAFFKEVYTLVSKSFKRGK